MYLLTILDLISDVVGNKTCYDTSAKQDGTTISLKKTEKNEGKFYLNKIIFSLEKSKIPLFEIKLVVHMLYVVYI